MSEQKDDLTQTIGTYLLNAYEAFIKPDALKKQDPVELKVKIQNIQDEIKSLEEDLKNAHIEMAKHIAILQVAKVSLHRENDRALSARDVPLISSLTKNVEKHTEAIRSLDKLTIKDLVTNIASLKRELRDLNKIDLKPTDKEPSSPKGPSI